MFNTGTPIMDQLNEEIVEGFGPDLFTGHPESGQVREVPFTLMITQNAVPESDAERGLSKNVMPMFSQFTEDGLAMSSFPEEWLDWSEYSDGHPVLSTTEVTEVEVYEAEVLDSIDEFISEPDEEENGQTLLQIGTLTSMSVTDETGKIVGYRSQGKVLLGEPITLTPERRTALLELAQADGQPWTEDQDESGWTDHMAEMMYGKDLDDNEDSENHGVDHTPDWIKTIEKTSPENMRKVINEMTMEEYQEFMNAATAFDVKVPGYTPLSGTPIAALPPQPQKKEG